MNEALMFPNPRSESLGGGLSNGAKEENVDTNRARAVIVPMDASSVQRIVAGQAITDLASAVKELIDNALDAGSKTINIRLFNQGLDIVEVSDDGCGVPIESRPFMAMKHATSKIRNFDDIYSTDSLGFRGEALFCLANISRNLVVATRTADQPLGQKLEFSRDGYLLHETACSVPRKVGTTVAVVKLFDALPVRRADLEKRIQVQRREVFLMVQGYAIHSLGVKFNLFDIASNGREEMRLSTMHGTSKLDETISSVLGSTFLSGMSRISIDLPIDDSNQWRVEGLISKAPHLTARDGSFARNAQFFCINGRPVDLPKVSRALSDVWRKIETTSKKKPACVLHFMLPKNSCDVNLSPNKRQVLLTDEHKICALVSEGALALWNNQRDGKFLSNELDIREGNVDAACFVNDMSPKGRKVKRRLGFYNDFRHVKLQHDSETSQLQGSKESAPPPNAITPPQQSEGTEESPLAAGNVEVARSHEEPGIASHEQQYDKPTDADRRLFVKVQEHFRRGAVQVEVQPLQQIGVVNPHDDDGCETASKKRKNGLDVYELIASGEAVELCSKRSTSSPSEDSDVRPGKKRALTMKDFGFRPIEVSESTKRRSQAHEVPETSSNLLPAATNPQIDRPFQEIDRNPRETISFVGSNQEGGATPCQPEANATDTRAKDEDKGRIKWSAFQGTDAVIQSSRKARLGLRDCRRLLQAVKSERLNGGASTQVENFDGNQEEDVDTDRKSSIISLSKKDFENMHVIGQFNLGFILAKCRNNNLWILDQHACDEKYNFERLCATTVIHEQKLLAPMPLELSPSEETCILENRQVFEQNGFRFEYKEENPPRHRFALTSLPHSGARDGRKAVQFGKDDVHALCAVLGADGASYSPQDGGTGVDGTGIYGNNAVRRYAGLSQNGEKAMLRLPKAVAMFANRACRGSVMIGTALSKKEMETIVQRLASVDHPWNCPHGRPTLKHVKDTLGTQVADTSRTLRYSVGPTMSTMTELTQPEDMTNEVNDTVVRLV